jgi:hypothetical protein
VIFKANMDISERLAACQEIIRRKTSWFQGKKDIERKLGCFSVIQEFGRPSDIHFVAGFLLDDHHKIREKAAETIEFFLRQLKSRVNYEATLRNVILTDKELDYWRVSFEESVYESLLAVASFNGNGYIREKALRELSRLRSPVGFRFILYRLGDWVRQVREVADAAVRCFLSPEYIKLLLAELPVMDEILQVRRVNLSVIHDSFVEFIVQRERSEEFLKLVDEVGERARTAYYKHFLKSGNFDEVELRRISTDRSFMVRFLTIKQISRFDASYQKEMIRTLMHDGSSRIRLTALYASSSFAPGLDGEIFLLLSDKSPAVREVCRAMSKSKNLNFAEIYRTRVKDKQDLEGSIMGLCEAGERGDLTIFVENSQLGKAVVVLGCLTAIYRIDEDLAIAYSLSLLEFPSNIVRKKASAIICKHPQNGVLLQLRSKYSAGDPLMRQVVLKVYKRIGGWRVVANIIDALTDEHDGVRDLAWEILGKWRIQATRLFTVASAEDIDRASKALQKIDTGVISDSRKALLRDVAFFVS